MRQPIRVLLADDHAGVRSAVRGDLEEAGFVVCAEAGRASEAVEAAVRERPDLCLLDVRMPGSGPVAAWDITSLVPSTKVVMLTTSRSDEHELAALRAGAVGYVLKDTEGARLADELHAFMGGEVGVSPRVASRLLELARPRGAGRRRMFGRHTAEGTEEDPLCLLRLMGEGSSIREAAGRLGLSLEDARAKVRAVLERVRIERAALSSLND